MKSLNNLKFPLIQGGMGVGISLSHLAGEVAKCGCMGTISAADIGFRKKDFFKNSKKNNYEELKAEIERAKKISEGEGLVAINIMYASEDYEGLVKKSAEFGIDAIVSGAGLPLNLAELTKDYNLLIAPVVSGLRALKIILKRWAKVNRLPDFIVIEGPLAGGHLGFKDPLNSESLLEITREIKIYLDQNSLDIKIFSAGGIRTKKEFEDLKEMGAYGIQVATPFIASYECDGSDEFKNTIISASDRDLEIINSPVGMPARAVRNRFLNDIYKKKIRPRNFPCIKCIKTCDGKTMKYCITEYLIKSARGQSGLVFSGGKIDGINKIRSVKEIIGDYF